VKPGPRLLRALQILLGLSLCLVGVRVVELPGDGALTATWIGAVVALSLIALIDGLRCMRETPVRMTRQLPLSFALGRSNRVALRIENPLGRAVQGRAIDHFPALLQVAGIPRDFDIPAGGELAFDYRVLPTRRGELQFDVAELEVDSPWRLWRRRIRHRESQGARVYPDFLTLGNMREFSQEQGAALLGIHLQRQRGEGTDFLQLREFREGDSLRQVEWKASSRLCKLVSREYQDEQDRDIIFLLDCGRRMHGGDGDLGHFDHALNAILLTAWFALRQGDGVGVCTFAGRDLWLEPRRHQDGIHRLLEQLYDLHTTTQSTDFIEAAQRLLSRRNKRALVIVVTNLQTEDRDDLDTAVRVLNERHAVIVANLREFALVEHAAREAAGFEEALKLCVATDLLRGRERVVQHLRRRGAWVVDCLPHQLNTALAGQYLALKRAGAV